MSLITISDLQYMKREQLADLLAAPTSKLAIIDVRDSDHVGGHISSSTWIPSNRLDIQIPELANTLQDRDKIVFHCALSQQRGPSAALRYLRERERLCGRGASEGQEVFVLEGGFTMWQAKYGEDKKLTEAYVKDIWRD